MSLISIERYKIIKSSLQKNLNMNQVVFSILGSVFLGIFWALLPIFGWSHYSLEGALTSCSVEWNEKSFNVLSYNVTILITVFIIPVSIILITNTKLIFMVKKTLEEIFYYLKFYLFKRYST